MTPTGARALLQASDTARRFVRLNRVNAQGFVEFSFGIGSPDLMVELILDPMAYREFCEANQAIELTDGEIRAIEEEQTKWRYGRPGIHE
jgi:phenol hydroxylase P0 protein